MKTLKYQSLVMLAAIGLSVQPNYAADSLSPSGYLNAGAGSDLGTSYLSTTTPSSIIGGPASSMDLNALTLGSAPFLNNPSQSFAASAPSGFQNSIPGGAQPLTIAPVIPEPSTLALTCVGGLTALVFMRRFGRTNRA